MKIPKRVQDMVEDGLIDEVIRPLMSGKEAAVFLVVAGGELRCAKVYKDAASRSFRQRADYQEGRNVRSSRTGRAISKRSRFGKAELEEAWHNAEVDALQKLASAGVRVPRCYRYDDGVLIMDLIADGLGNPAPRLVDLDLLPDEARAFHQRLLRDVVRMLCAGIIHGDLSEYNVLVDPDGPVIIDLPQAIAAASNQSARNLLLRDVENLASYLGKFAPDLRLTDYGRELWHLYESGRLTPDTPLTGRFQRREQQANVAGVLGDIADAREDAERRGVTGGRRRRGGGPRAEGGAPGKPERGDGPRSDARPPRRPQGAAVQQRGQAPAPAARPQQGGGGQGAAEGDAPRRPRRRGGRGHRR